MSYGMEYKTGDKEIEKMIEMSECNRNWKTRKINLGSLDMF